MATIASSRSVKIAILKKCNYNCCIYGEIIVLTKKDYDKKNKAIRRYYKTEELILPIDEEIIILSRKNYDEIDKTIKKCHKAEELLEEALEEKRESMKKQIIIYGPDYRAIIDIQSSLLEIKSFISILQDLK